MPKLPSPSGADIVKRLERLGFEQVRQRGSHVVMRKGAAGTVVPMHWEVRSGTVNGILRQAQISADAILAALD